MKLNKYRVVTENSYHIRIIERTRPGVVRCQNHDTIHYKIKIRKQLFIWIIPKKDSARDSPKWCRSRMTGAIDGGEYREDTKIYKT